MATTDADLSLTTAPAPEGRAPAPGFPGLRCPLCGQVDDAVISLDLDDLANCHCHGCSEDFAIADVRETIAAWQRVLAWIDAAPRCGP